MVKYDLAVSFADLISSGRLSLSIKKIFIPKDNLRDIEELSNEITDKLEFIPVTNYMEIFNEIKKENYS